MSIIEKAVSWARSIAADNSHGYDQAQRWGKDYDCSSFVISAYKQAGVLLSCTYTGNMRGDMLRHGFTDVTGSVNMTTGAGLQAGDVLLNHMHHTALYTGGGKVLQASINELGTTTGGKTGDQTGREIGERGYYNYPWDCVLRYAGDSGSSPDTKPQESGHTYSVRLPLLKKGAAGGYVRTAQLLLIGAGMSVGPAGADGDFGRNTETAVIKFQQLHELEDDGEIGGVTWAELLKG